MTPNPHPASGNGDVIERAARLAAFWHGQKITGPSRTVASDKGIEWKPDHSQAERYADQHWQQYVEILPAFIAAGLLKLSEGSGDGKMREIPALEIPDGLCAETKALVVLFANVLAAKLHAAEIKCGYREGWATSDWESECREHLYQHLAKGDPRDVAAYCAFMWMRGWSTAPSPIDAEGMREAKDHRLVSIDDLAHILGMLPPPELKQDGLIHRFEPPNAVDLLYKIRSAFEAMLKRALPTPAREIDREKISDVILQARSENWAPNKTADAILSLIGGRHV